MATAKPLANKLRYWDILLESLVHGFSRRVMAKYTLLCKNDLSLLK